MRVNNYVLFVIVSDAAISLLDPEMNELSSCKMCQLGVVSVFFHLMSRGLSWLYIEKVQIHILVITLALFHVSKICKREKRKRKIHAIIQRKNPLTILTSLNPLLYAELTIQSPLYNHQSTQKSAPQSRVCLELNKYIIIPIQTFTDSNKEMCRSVGVSVPMFTEMDFEKFIKSSSIMNSHVHA